MDYDFDEANNWQNGKAFDMRIYSYQTLYEQKGVCGERAKLLLKILTRMGYNATTIGFYYVDHEIVGLSCNSTKAVKGYWPGRGNRFGAL